MKKQASLILPLLLSSAGFAQNAEEMLAFNPKRTWIPSLVSSPSSDKDCGSQLLEKLANQARLPTDYKERFDSTNDFMKALCLFHGGATTQDQKEDLIEAFQKKVTVNLPKQQMLAASLYEGILHCQVAEMSMVQDNTGWHFPKDELNVTKFCAHRKMAKEALGNINWAELHLEYESEATNDSLDGRMQEVAQCGKFVLADINDTGCGELTALSKDTIESTAAAAAQEIMAHYFDVSDSSAKGQSAPYSAMLARKVAMTKDTILRSSENFALLADDNRKLTSSIDTLGAIYGSFDGTTGLFDGSGSYPSTVAAMQKSYLDAINRGQTLYSLAKKWEEGLYTSDTGGRENFLKSLTERNTAIQQQKAYLEGKSITSQEDPLSQQIKAMLTTIKALAPKRDENAKNMTRALCALYYCEIRGKANFDKHNGVCTTVLQGTNKYIYDYNPLCERPESKIAGMLTDGKETLTVSELCTRVAFPTKYMLKAGEIMSAADTNSCMIDPQVFDKNIVIEIPGA